MSPVIYEFNNQTNDKSIELRNKDEFDDSKQTKIYTLDEAIEETSTFTRIPQIFLLLTDRLI